MQKRNARLASTFSPGVSLFKRTEENMSVNTPHKARELVKGFPDALTSEILDRATQLKVVKNELRWKAKNANPVDNRLIFDAAGYLKFLRAEYFDEYMEVNRDLKDAEAINDLMGLLYDYEKSADVVDDGAPSPISWNAISNSFDISGSGPRTIPGAAYLFFTFEAMKKTKLTSRSGHYPG